jgi:hypothetical protein
MSVQREWQRTLDQSAPTPTKPTCPVCTAPATVYVRSASLRFADQRCDPCAQFVLSWAAKKGATDVTLDKLVGVELPTTIDSIDLAQLAQEVLDCAVGDHDVRTVQNVPGAVAAVMTVLAGKVRREIKPSEQAAVIDATRKTFVARMQENRAALQRTQAALRSPFSVFGARAS